VARRPKTLLSDDVTVGPRFVGVGGEGLGGFEAAIAPDGKAEFAA
jgi:hypothetical protein